MGVQVEQPRILTDCVQYYFEGIKEETYSRHQQVPLSKLFNVAISEQDKLLCADIARLEVIIFALGIAGCNVYRKYLTYRFSTFGFFKLIQDLNVLSDKVFEDRLQQLHRLVLERVADVLQIFSQGSSVVVIDADVYQLNL